MEVEKFDLAFTHAGTKFSATCQKFQVHNYPQIRVAIGKKNGYEDVFIYYHIDEPGRVLFWFPLPGRKEAMAKEIAKSLETLLSAKKSR